MQTIVLTWMQNLQSKTVRKLKNQHSKFSRVLILRWPALLQNWFYSQGSDLHQDPVKFCVLSMTERQLMMMGRPGVVCRSHQHDWLVIGPLSKLLLFGQMIAVEPLFALVKVVLVVWLQRSKQTFIKGEDSDKYREKGTWRMITMIRSINHTNLKIIVTQENCTNKFTFVLFLAKTEATEAESQRKANIGVHSGLRAGKFEVLFGRKSQDDHEITKKLWDTLIAKSKAFDVMTGLCLKFSRVQLNLTLLYGGSEKLRKEN